YTLLLHSSAIIPHLPSFPTRRSSDLFPRGTIPSRAPQNRHPFDGLILAFALARSAKGMRTGGRFKHLQHFTGQFAIFFCDLHNRDRKSTRLNSSHVSISYAVFCLKKK